VTLDRRLLHPRNWSQWFTIGLLYLGGLLPWRLQRLLAHLGGDLMYLLARFRRQVALVNIGLCFPELTPSQRRRMVREIFASHIMGLLETTVAWWGGDSRLDGRIEVNGVEKLNALQAQGQCVILLGCHLTTLDFAGRMLRRYTDIDVVYRNQKYPVYDFFMRTARERLFKHAIERSDMRQLIRCLKQGRTVWYAADQDYGLRNAVFAPFFGIEAATLTATSRLAKMTGAPIFLYTHYRLPGSRYQINIEGPFEGFPSGDDVADATFVNGLVENAVRRHPEQYMWLHKRFKSRPPGQPSVYPPRPRKRKRSRDLR
jgi:KDO2-lipid IV(A) lauroyltransferase